jgi:hypothetical protein
MAFGREPGPHVPGSPAPPRRSAPLRSSSLTLNPGRRPGGNGLSDRPACAASLPMGPRALTPLVPGKLTRAPVQAPNVRGAGRGGNGLFRGPACAASSEDFLSALVGSAFGRRPHRGGGPRGRSLPRPLRCGRCEWTRARAPQHRLRFGSAEGLSTVDSAAPTYANGRLAEGLSTVDSAAPTHANGGAGAPAAPGSPRR